MLRARLAALGVQFFTPSDTEVLIEAYRRWGADCLDLLSGMFALAIRDAEAQQSSTRWETFCSVAAESLACGTPLILTRRCGPEEFVTAANGVMVEADDPRAFAKCILQAFQR